MGLGLFTRSEEGYMATTKSPAGKTPASAPKKAVTKVTPDGGKPAASKAETAAKTKAAPKTVPTTAPRARTAKAAPPRSLKPAGIPLEQRRHYVEVAAYHIAERRGFTVGNPLEDWMQAEAEIDRLLAEGRLGA